MNFSKVLIYQWTRIRPNAKYVKRGYVHEKSMSENKKSVCALTDGFL